MLGGNQHPIQGGVEILLVAYCYRNREKFPRHGPSGSTHSVCVYVHSNGFFLLCIEGAVIPLAERTTTSIVSGRHGLQITSSIACV